MAFYCIKILEYNGMSDPAHQESDANKFRCLDYFTAVRRCVCKWERMYM